MAAFFANIQVRTDDREAVIEAVEALLAQAGYAPEDEAYGGDRSVYVGPESNSWVAVFDSACDGVSVGPLVWLAQGLSARLETTTLAWLVHDSALLLYLLFDQGEVRDRYISRLAAVPAGASQAPAAGDEPLGGDGDQLLAAAGIPGDGRRLTLLLRQPDAFAEETLRTVAAALGQRYADLGHADVETDALADAHLENPEDFDRLEFRLTDGEADAGR